MIRFLLKVRVELAVNDDQADRVVTAIETSAKPGRIGDGKIFVMPLITCCAFEQARPTGMRSDSARGVQLLIIQLLIWKFRVA